MDKPAFLLVAMAMLVAMSMFNPTHSKLLKVILKSVISQEIHDVFMGFFYGFHGFPMVFSMVFLWFSWISYGFSWFFMVFLWFFLWFPQPYVWTSRRPQRRSTSSSLGPPGGLANLGTLGAKKKHPSSARNMLYTYDIYIYVVELLYTQPGYD